MENLILNETSNLINKLHYSLWYFLIFSILGLVFETVFCFVTTGTIESRKEFLIGPFCPVYGIGATALILALAHFNKNIKVLFFFGVVIGSIVEYVFDFVFEAMCGIKFWDYTYLPLNLNGRICIMFSLLWGILTVLLIKFIKPIVDKLIHNISYKLKLDVPIFAFFILNLILTVWALSAYAGRNKNLNLIVNNNLSEFQKTKLYIEDIYFTNERLSSAFPNLRYKNKFGMEIFIKDNF